VEGVSVVEVVFKCFWKAGKKCDVSYLLLFAMKLPAAEAKAFPQELQQSAKGCSSNRC